MTACGLIHASILKMGRSYVTEEEEAEFIHHCRDFALRWVPSKTLPLHPAMRSSWLEKLWEWLLHQCLLVSMQIGMSICCACCTWCGP